MNVDSYTPGRPCWADAMCSDVDKAAVFYSALFGWEVPEGNPDFGGYRSCTLNGRTVAGLMQDMGGPIAWNSYIAVADADATVAAAEAAGGSSMYPPMDFGGLGRMGALIDPAGAVCGIWQPGAHTGAQVYGEPGALCWAELTTTSTEDSKAFYGSVFGWTLGGGDAYTEFGVDGQMVAGVIAPPMAGMPNFWGVYFAVEDCDAAIAKVLELGGAVHLGATDNPAGRFAVVADPNGAIFNIIALNPLPQG